MPTTDTPTPCVAAILVVHNGEEWLGSALATIAAQRYPALDLVVVDNASRDSGPDLLNRHIHADRLITLSRNVGFGRAVAAAMKHPAVGAADYLLLLHDDLVLAPDAIAELVEAIQADPTLGIVGPKLREWSEEYVIQEVGMTTDRFGRAETQLEPGELDQGQHDHQRDVLYVSTAGMLLRRDVLSMLGGFDARFPAFRDDLDLCWRAWLVGMRVEVVPEAVGYHIAASSRLPRAPLAARSGHARYFAERHTVATLLKNYSALRLAWVLPVVILLAVGKIGGFLATRRFADAAAVTRAYLWNLRQLPPTLRRRRAVQRRRVVSDAELTPLFAPGLPRMRAYAEAVSVWLAGVDTRALIDDSGEFQRVDPQDDALASKPMLRVLRDHPAASAGAALAVCYLIGLIPLLGAGQVVGGEIAPWPSTSRAFLRAYASSWNGQPLASSGFSSPAQALLGLLGFLGFGSAWLAQRLLVFGLLPLAWGFALRAGRLVTTRKGPRVLGATLYVLNPVLLGALAQGRYGTLVTAALLPGLVLVTIRTMDARTAPGSAWRASALLALGLATVIAFAPVLGLVLGAALGAVTVFTALRGLESQGGRDSAHPGSRQAGIQAASRQAALRLVAGGVAAVVLNAPWLIDIVREGGLVLRGAQPGSLPLWRALTMVPDVLDGLRGPVGILTAAISCAVIVAAVGVGLRSRPGPVAGLVTVVAGSGLAAWGASRLGIDEVWVPALLLPGALALAVLGVIAARWLSPSLRAYDFGARQLTTAIAAGIVMVGIGGGVVRLVAGPWDGLSRNPELVPAFVSADLETVGPYRVLLLADSGGAVRWDVTNATGPSMVESAMLRSPRFTRFLEAAIGRATGGADPSAGAQLGLANIRYVVLVRSSEALARALARQPALEPLPSSGGRVYRVRTWLPRAVVLPSERGDGLLATGDPGITIAPVAPADSSGAAPQAPSPGLESARLEARAGLTAYQGRATGDGGLLVVSEAEDTEWHATANGKSLERAPLPPVNAFRLPSGQSDVEVRTSGGAGRKVLVAAQLLLVLAVISLALRPPGFTQRRVERSTVRSLPPELSDPRQSEGVVQ
ncbi:MAG: glycosyltransferase [Egibacteraceae bacterium]